MKELQTIRIGSCDQLGSLEDRMPVKRLSGMQIKKLRAQAQEQEGLRWSFVRMAVKLWSDFVEQVGLLLSRQHNTYCLNNGHSMFWHSGTYRCRYCGTQSCSAQSILRQD